jgi:hypothetical protein
VIRLIALLCLFSGATALFQLGGTSGVGGHAGTGGGSVFTRGPSCVAVGTGSCTINDSNMTLDVVSAVIQGAAVTVFTENKSNTIQTPASAAWTLSTTCAGQIYYIYNPTVGSGHTFTGGAAGNVYIVSSWAGTDTTSAVFDTGHGASQSGGVSTTMQPGAATPAQANDLVIGLVQNCDGGTAFTLPLLFNTINSSTSAGFESLSSYTYPGTTSINPSWFLSTRPNAGAAQALFKHQ